MMKKYFFFFLLFSLSQIATAQESSLLKFDERQIDLGDVVKGSVVDTAFYFTNASEEEIQIDIIDACECTTLDWTMDVIRPGEKGYIRVSFDSAKKDKEEAIDIDITLINEDPRTGGPVMDNVTYIYRFINK